MKDGKTYTLDAIKTAIFHYSLLEPVLPCNRDKRGNYQNVLQFIKDDDVQFSNSTVVLSAQKYTWNN